MFLKYFFIIFLLFNSSFAYQFKIKSVSLRSLIEKEADFWYIDNLELLKNNPTETKELAAILKISIERSLAIINCQTKALEMSELNQEIWQQINKNRLNPINLELDNLKKFKLESDFFESINNFQTISAQYALLINNHNFKRLDTTFKNLKKNSRKIIVQSLKNITQDRSSIMNSVKDKLPIIKEMCGNFGTYLWEKLPNLSLKSFKALDDEFQQASDYAWLSVITMEKQSCFIWNNIEMARGYFYNCCLKNIN